MKIVALYKTFEGEEFVEASIESIYNYCDKIIFIHSNVSWNGDTGNTVIEPVKKWKEKYDKENKIDNVIGEWKTQDEQYDFGWNYIKKYDFDYCLLIDTDEVWTNSELDKCIVRLADSNGKSFSCRIYTYVKSPYWRVEPVEPVRPIIFVKKDVDKLLGVRGNMISDRVHWDDIKYHHFCYVRKNEDIIKRKFKTSEAGDKAQSNSNWIEDKWNKLPDVYDFHPTIGAEKAWHSIVKINDSDLPETVLDNNIVKNWRNK